MCWGGAGAGAVPGTLEEEPGVAPAAPCDSGVPPWSDVEANALYE